jgi:microcystin-dependent protein
MAAIWPGGRTPWIDENGDPMVGAQLFFYDAGTTTPQVVYSDAALSVPHDQPILADARGRFPIIYLNPTPGSYRQKMLEADDTLFFDDDEISVPQAADYTPPDAGDTSVDLLARTGDLKPHYGTDAMSGWVRAAGRTIGSATSGATERANADCEDLFLHLWTVDSTLSVSGGRGGTAAGDWAANKTITLPDFRERVFAGLATMGNTDAGRVADSLVDGGETSSILGATAGADDVVLTEANLAAHDHDAGELLMPNHGHPVRTSEDNASSSDPTGGVMLRGTNVTTKAAYTGTPSNTAGQQVGGSGTASITGSTADAGSGTAHNNMQPTMFVLVLIKL